MTSLYAPARVPSERAAIAPFQPPQASRIRRWFRDPTWPLQAVLLGFPAFWVLGLGEFSWPIMALPMLYELRRLNRPVRVPPYFGVWLAMLLWVFAGALMIGQHLPGTLPGSGGFTGWSVRASELVAATITLLYVGNLTEEELPKRKLIRWLCFLFGVIVVGGLLGVFLGNVSFTSPFELILPRSIRANFYVKQLVHPGFAQVEDVLGHTSPRPRAPFAYTNTWGNNLSLLLVWFVVGWWVYGSRRSKWVVAATLCIAAVPVIYSLNRGVWIGLGLSVLYLAFHLAARGKLGLLASALAIAAIGALVFALTPLNSIVTQRLAHPASNSIRGSLNSQALHAATESPIIGWGTTRNALGSPSSIAIGKSSDCPQCGNAAIGSTGELWGVLISNGFVGAVLYMGYFLLMAFHYRRDRTPEGMATRLILYLAPFYALFYPELPTALSLTFVSLAIVWRANAPKTPEGYLA